jgi:plastocyanin domain-containing protein
MSPQKISLLIILIGVAISSLIFFFDFGNQKEGKGLPPLGNVFIQAGKQTINITAKGGFEPATSIAKAGVPTVLRITTEGTYDCSSVVSIPELGVRKNLPASGVTEINIGTRPAGVLNGTCGMGMYPFTIEFK